jgi:uncharacterized protein (DUF1015 family)
MAIVKPFYCVRPSRELAARVAALPYDVYSRAEAREETEREPLSFLNIDRPETQFPEDFDMYSEPVYEKARDMIGEWIRKGIFLEDPEECYYIYEQTMDGRRQTGIVACSSVDDYIQGVIRKHELTRAEKEADRIRHIDVCDAQTGPIFLAYRNRDEIRAIVSEGKKQEPLYDFVTREGVAQRVWKLSGAETVKALEEAFARVPNTYIADGHHRAASAVKVGCLRREAHPGYTGEEPFNTFLSVLFPEEELHIMDYNRIVKDLNGLSAGEFLDALTGIGWEVKKAEESPFSPARKGEFGLYLEGTWYAVGPKVCPLIEDPVKNLDVSILQDQVLYPILGIGDPRTDARIDFVGGIRGLRELERRCEDGGAAFAMYPTSMEELFAVADQGRLMPPKSTWFEPKLLSGLFLHKLS